MPHKRTELPQSLTEILTKVNIKCEDDRHGFKDSKKTDTVDRLLRESQYRKISDGRLTKIYSQLKISELQDRNLLVVSSHIDTVYDNFYFRDGSDVVTGTLDNSITNAVLIDIIRKNRLPEEVIVAFTGNEEKESLGVDETVSFLHACKANVEFAVSLDVTNRGYRNHGYTIENYFVRKGDRRIFSSKRQFLKYIIGLLEKKKVKSIHHVGADPDDTWQFDEHNMNCFTFCLPCRGIAFHNDWMHDDIGFVVRKSAIIEFRAGLLLLLKRLSGDL